MVGNGVKEYDAEITRIDMNHEDTNKVSSSISPISGFLTPPAALSGHAGSPILQNGKVIGAVTHVFVQDAASGYGIFIENMLSVSEKGFLQDVRQIGGRFCRIGAVADSATEFNPQ